MRYVQLPGTDLTLSAVCLGTSGFGGSVLEPQAFDLLDAFLALGGNFIDTALIYSDWLPGPRSMTEKLLGRWLQTRGLHAHVVVATKGAHPDLHTMHVPRLSPDDLISDIDQSLRNLQTERIDLYWLHRDDINTPIGEIIDTLHAQAAAGKIRYFGCSNWSVARITEAQAYAEQRGIQGFVANQPMWSLAQPNFAAFTDQTLVVLDDAGLDFHRRTGLPLIPYSAQAHGFFTKLDAGGRAALSPSNDAQYYNETNLRRLHRAQELAQQHSVPIGAVALSYLSSQKVTTVPVVGCKRLDHLQESISAADLILTQAEMDSLEHA